MSAHADVPWGHEHGEACGIPPPLLLQQSNAPGLLTAGEIQELGRLAVRVRDDARHIHHGRRREDGRAVGGEEGQQRRTPRRVLSGRDARSNFTGRQKLDHKKEKRPSEIFLSSNLVADN